MECGICFEKFPIDVINFFPCCHFICNFCHVSLKKDICPYCRIPSENLQDSDDENCFFEIEIPDIQTRKRKNKKKKKKFRHGLINNS